MGASSSSPQNHTILVVDDEAEMLSALRALFLEAFKGTRVLIARSGPQALTYLKTEPVDLIVTDHRMPGMDGVAFLMEARKAAPAVPRILMTAYPDLEVAMRAINDAGVEKFIAKPFEPKAIVDVVKSTLFEQGAQEFFRSFIRSVDMMRVQLKMK